MAKKKSIGLFGVVFSVTLVGLLWVNLSVAYYGFLRGSARTAWPATAFTKTYLDGSVADQTLWGAPLSGMGSVGQLPNDDTAGLLIVADQSLIRNGSHRINCTDGPTTRFGPPQQAEYQAIFTAMAAWDQVASSSVNFAFVCSFADFGTASFDNVVDADSLDVWRNGQPVFNGFNEIIFDDTTGASMVNALNLGIDPTVLLGLAFPFDTNNMVISNTSSNGTVKEGFIILNRGPNAPQADLQGTITHELGHLLGLGHTPSVNAIGSGDGKTPTMYFASLSDATQTRTLETDDIAGITASYPAASQPLLSFGTISGTALSLGGTPLLGTAVVIRDNANNEINVVVGGLPGQSSGTYKIEGIPAGNYRAQLLALDGTANAGRVNSSPNGNLDGIFPSAAFSFNTVFFPNNTQEANAQAITVAVGQDTPNINFGVSTNGASGLNGQVRADPGGGCMQSKSNAFFDFGCFLLVLAFFRMKKKHA